MSTPLVDAIITETAPGDLLREVSARMLALADAATTGAWHEMHLGSEGCVVLNDGRLRDRKTVARFGSKEWKADHADAAYVTGMQPAVARATARLLAELGEHADHNSHGALVADGLDIARAFMDATGWRP